MNVPQSTKVLPLTKGLSQTLAIAPFYDACINTFPAPFGWQKLAELHDYKMGGYGQGTASMDAALRRGRICSAARREKMMGKED